MEFIDCVLEGGNDECECQKRQDRKMEITRECFDYSTASTFGIALIVQLIFLLIMKHILCIWLEKCQTNDKSSSNWKLIQ